MHGVQLPPHQDIRLHVKLALVELVSCHCPVRVHFLITIHVIMEPALNAAALHSVKTHTRQQTRFAPVSPKALRLDTQEWPPCPLSPSSHPQNVLHQILLLRHAAQGPRRVGTEAHEQRGRRRRPPRGPQMLRPSLKKSTNSNFGFHIGYLVCQPKPTSGGALADITVPRATEAQPYQLRLP